jgi:hypothetical protein
MSQSDYINYKKTGIILKNSTNTSTPYDELDPVLAPSTYVSLKSYTLENTIKNTKSTYNLLTPSGEQIVFDMDRPKASSCTQFIVCSGTNARPNRVALKGYQRTCFPVMKAPGRTVPRYNKKPIINKNTNYKITCKCENVECKCTVACQTGTQGYPCTTKAI